MNRFDRLIRRIVPSTVVLSRNPLIQFLGWANDLWLRLLYPEMRALPPNHLRMRVGVGNRIFFNQILCLRSGYNFWLFAFAKGFCRLDSSIVEIGCGYGRKPEHLKNFRMGGERFTGRYVGVDIDPDLLGFARNHFPPDQFQFLQTTQGSTTYASNGARLPGSEFRFPLPDASQDFVFSTSLFTHLLEAELANYVRESLRILKPGGTMLMNYFCYDHLSSLQQLRGRWTFHHQVGQARVESLESPEAAVAYGRSFMEDLCRTLGFSEATTLLDHQMMQSQVLCRK
ncbi:MAG: hypothetical protein AMXMBFR33_42930 [Candidatus Xenobia bacterium]|jgi:SAM-dependent methyltransferase